MTHSNKVAIRDGTVVKKYEAITENGKELGHKLVSEEVTEAKINRVMEVIALDPNVIPLGSTV